MPVVARQVDAESRGHPRHPPLGTRPARPWTSVSDYGRSRSRRARHRSVTSGKKRERRVRLKERPHEGVVHKAGGTPGVRLTWPAHGPATSEFCGRGEAHGTRLGLVTCRPTPCRLRCPLGCSSVEVRSLSSSLLCSEGPVTPGAWVGLGGVRPPVRPGRQGLRPRVCPDLALNAPVPCFS